MNTVMDFVLNILFISLTFNAIFEQVEGRSTREIGLQCRKIPDCECGEQCVDVNDLKPCRNGTIRNCACLKGCAVGNVFIPAGLTRPNTYCNLCRCQLESGNGIPRCTRLPWCSFPENVTEYIENPNCQPLVQPHYQQGRHAYNARPSKSWRYPPFKASGPMATGRRVTDRHLFNLGKI